MREIYDWVPWFRELSKKIEDGGEAYLIEKANEVDWGNSHRLLEYGDENIDPFSFFYFLASKNTKNFREPVYHSVHSVFDIEGEPPKTGGEDTFVIPTPSGINVLFHDATNFHPDLLWRLFRQAAKDKPNIQAEDFYAVLKINKVAVPKLTQTLFLINPCHFIPIDHLFKLLIGEYNQSLRKDTDINKQIEAQLTELTNSISAENGWNFYKNEIERVRQTFPGCHQYEINLFLFYFQPDKIELGRNFYQISTIAYNDGVDHWNDFEKNNWVFTGGPGSNEYSYPLEDPEPGDIILVRTGEYRGRAIGIVEKNDYANKGYNKDGKIHVLWINKTENEFPTRTGVRVGFSKVGADYEIYKSFRKITKYLPTFEFIERLTQETVEEDPTSYPTGQEQKQEIMENHHPLNQILYGPPGTGKTWNTVNHAVAIIEGKPVDDYEEDKDRKMIKKRFKELKDAGQIEMVTFHQNYAYEDFIEGIRPVLSREQKTEDVEQEDKRDIKYKLSEGIFKRIANCAEENRAEEKNYVLIIDEINRGNIAKIFGELITLIEESKRLGNHDEATTVLPYSKKSFGAPNNLYIIGTMNTADRSIALLDTALRRRFDFVEMMPDPEHSGISKDIQGVNCQGLLEKINERIRILHDRDHQIGHTYFLDVKNLDSLAKTFKNRIIPLLQEYFYDNWEKIDLVLNKNGFIQESGVNEGLFKASEFVDTEHKIYELLSANDDKWQDPDSYINIYQTPKQSSQEGQENQNA